MKVPMSLVNFADFSSYGSATSLRLSPSPSTDTFTPNVFMISPWMRITWKSFIFEIFTLSAFFSCSCCSGLPRTVSSGFCASTRRNAACMRAISASPNPSRNAFTPAFTPAFGMASMAASISAAGLSHETDSSAYCIPLRPSGVVTTSFIFSNMSAVQPGSTSFIANSTPGDIALAFFRMLSRASFVKRGSFNIGTSSAVICSGANSHVTVLSSLTSNVAWISAWANRSWTFCAASSRSRRSFFPTDNSLNSKSAIFFNEVCMSLSITVSASFAVFTRTCFAASTASLLSSLTFVSSGVSPSGGWFCCSGPGPAKNARRASRKRDGR